jgi:hypothetical protein
MTRSEAEDLAARLRRRLRPLDVGPVARVQQLKQPGFLHISLRSRTTSSSEAGSSYTPEEQERRFWRSDRAADPSGGAPSQSRTFPVPKVRSALWSRAVAARLLDRFAGFGQQSHRSSAPTWFGQTYGRRTRPPGGDRRIHAGRMSRCTISPWSARTRSGPCLAGRTPPSSLPSAGPLRSPSRGPWAG